MNQSHPMKTEMTCEALWQRGWPGDPLLIQQQLEAHPELSVPSFLKGPEGVQMLCAVHREEDIERASVMLMDGYWNAPLRREQVYGALKHSQACVGARCLTSGALIAVCRATSDKYKYAAVYDVMVAPQWRQRGLGEALMRLLLAHPMLRDVYRIELLTKDAQRFYRQVGFIEEQEVPPRPYSVSRMMHFPDHQM